MKKLSAILLTAALAFPATSFAAVDGNLGATSTGNVIISLYSTSTTTAGQVQITGLEDFILSDVNNPTLSGANSVSRVLNNVCVYLDTASTYSIEVFSLNGGGGNFGYLVNGSHKLNYYWKFDDNNGNILTDRTGAGFVGSNTPGCTDSIGAQMTIHTAANLSNFDGELTDVFTITVAPE